MGLETWQLIALTSVASILLLGIGWLVLMGLFFRPVNMGQALVIEGPGPKRRVKFHRGLVLPLLHRAQTMDLTLHTLEVEHAGPEALVCGDGTRADVRVTFSLRIAREEDDVLRVVEAVGTSRADDPRALEALFQRRFSEAVRDVARQSSYDALLEQRQRFRDEIVAAVGQGLSGYTLDDVAIGHLARTQDAPRREATGGDGDGDGGGEGARDLAVTVWQKGG